MKTAFEFPLSGSTVPVDLGALGAVPVALLVWAIGLSLGGPTGYAINPARDLGPRIAHALLPIPGKGNSDWGYSWIPVVGPVVGGIVAALFYLRARQILSNLPCPCVRPRSRPGHDECAGYPCAPAPQSPSSLSSDASVAMVNSFNSRAFHESSTTPWDSRTRTRMGRNHRWWRGNRAWRGRGFGHARPAHPAS